MKKLLTIAAIALLAFSCTDDLEIAAPDDDRNTAGPHAEAVTRVAGSGTGVTIDAIKQLKGIDFKLHSTYKPGYFLSGDVKYIRLETNPFLHNYDSYIGNGEVHGFKRTSGYDDGYGRYYPLGALLSTKIKISKIPYNYTFERDNASRNNYFISVEKDGKKLYLDSKHNGYLGTHGYGFEIIPDEEFELVNITYAFLTDDSFTATPKYFSSRTLANNTDSPATRTMELSESITESSTFSALDGLTVSTKTNKSVDIKIPIIGGGTSINTEQTTTSNFSYTQGGTSTQTFTIKETVTQEVPPRTTYTVRIVATEYHTDITYYAELVGVKSRLPITLQGRWDAVLVSDTNIEIFDPNEVVIARMPTKLELR